MPPMLWDTKISDVDSPDAPRRCRRLQGLPPENPGGLTKHRRSLPTEDIDGAARQHIGPPNKQPVRRAATPPARSGAQILTVGSSEEGDKPALGQEASFEQGEVPDGQGRLAEPPAQWNRMIPITNPRRLLLALTSGIGAVSIGILILGVEIGVGPEGEVRVTGLALMIFLHVMNSPLLGYLLLSFLLNDSKFADVRRLAASLKVDLMYHPVVLPTQHQIQSAAESTTLLPKDSVLLALRSPGVHWSVLDYARAYRQTSLSPLDVAKVFLEQQAASDAARIPLLAVSQVNRSDVLVQAKASAQRYARKTPLGLFDGVPVLIKEDLDVQGYTTSMSTTFPGYLQRPAVQDALPVARLRHAGALIFGKTTMNKIRIGATRHKGRFSPRNPYNLSHYPNGLSSGSASAVAAGLVPLAVGSGSGSVRLPSSLSGCVGFKATYSRIPVHDHAHYASHPGLVGWSVSDVALGYLAMAGVPGDTDGMSVADIPGASQPKPHISGFPSKDLKGLRIGIDWTYFQDAEAEVVASCVRALRKLEEEGVTLQNISISHLEIMSTAQSLIVTSAMAQNFERVHAKQSWDFEKIWEEFVPEILMSLHIGKHMSHQDFEAAMKVRSFAVKQYQTWFESVDIIVTPTAGMVAPLLPEELVAHGKRDGTSTSTTARMKFVFTSNLAGFPALTLPVGYVEGLPIGMQLIAPWWQEHVLFQAGNILEQRINRLKPAVVFPSY